VRPGRPPHGQPLGFERWATQTVTFPGVSSSDRRAHDRHPYRTAAVLVLSNGTTFKGKTLDLGKGGAGVVTDLPVPINAVVTVRMTLPAKAGGVAPFEAPATVVNCSLAGSLGGFRIGLQFGSMPASAASALAGALP